MTHMIAPTITLNTGNARAIGVSEAITEKGSYVGKFTRAEIVQSDKGTIGVELDFLADDGRRARYLTLWLQNSKGEELHGRKVLDAILCCLQLRGLQPEEASMPKWDSEAREERSTRLMGYPALVGKAIGTVLIREEYAARDGNKWKTALACPFDAQTKRLAVEILDKKTVGELLPKLLERLQDRPLREGRGGASRGGNSSGGSTSAPRAASSGFDDMDDDIPF